ncbi:monooxygenase [Dictyobacter sp. S3.2.2.5]|uniref:Monooxygenase n=2 Tax=Dictyobacter halimunensis TaxID=3026934 RepID=A0ABQ6FNJ7_9CHLR|nr:monooxygenase [Dictyobacter sp. S3.2.2.5]
MNMPQKDLRVLVVGGGLGGLCLAQGLRKAGISVAVYERDRSPEARTQGYRFHMDIRGEEALRACLPTNLYELALAIRAQPSKGATVFRMVDGELREAATMRFPESGSSEFVTVGSSIDRLTLRHVLLAGLDDIVYFGKEFTRYEQQPDGTVRACFADGTDSVGDVLVAADGVGSRIREQFLPYAELIDTGVRWLGGKTLLTDELRTFLLPQLAETFGMVHIGAQSMLFGLVTFHQDPNQAAAHLWPGLRFHTTSDYVFWGVLVQQHQLAMSDDELNAMPGSKLQHLLLALVADWPPTLRMLIEQCQPDQTFVLRMRHARPIEQWQTTNVTLLGDAIHAMPPRGSGANTALRDARQLADSLIAVARLGTPFHQALHDYETEMVRYGFAALRASLQRPTDELRSGWFAEGGFNRNR